MENIMERASQYHRPVIARMGKRTTADYNERFRYFSELCAGMVNDMSDIVQENILGEHRNVINKIIRRCHKFCLEERIGSHYVEVGAEGKIDFEHLIPVTDLVWALFLGKLSAEEVCNAPTVALTNAKHRELKEAGWADRTPSIGLPFERYRCLGDLRIQTYDGREIDPETWTIKDHYDYFGNLFK